MAIYVDTLLAFRVRAENLGRRARQKIAGSFSLHEFGLTVMADWPARSQQKATKACHQTKEADWLCFLRLP